MIAVNRPEPRPEGDPSVLEPGQTVCHRRYGYRGVVVARDGICQADDDWYQGNRTQPDREQPWYHVLVDQSTSCTYVAAENLVADSSGLPVTHPLLPYLFSGFTDGTYIRNNEPWPG
ncbi:MAG: heat shock protein HspQ [Planctomycetaceae bacterium]